MSSLKDLVGRTVNIEIEGLKESNDPVEMAFVITNVVLNDFYFLDKAEEIYIEVYAIPADYDSWDGDLKEWWTENYSDHIFSLEQLKWHPDYSKRVDPS